VIKELEAQKIETESAISQADKLIIQFKTEIDGYHAEISGYN
jgi:hypothetical protein